jgi:hypothetical protein
VPSSSLAVVALDKVLLAVVEPPPPPPPHAARREDRITIALVLDRFSLIIFLLGI